MRRIRAALVALLAGLVFFVSGALAQPTNDDFSNATRLAGASGSVERCHDGP